MNDAVTSQARNHRAQKVIFVHNPLIYVSSIRVNQNWRMCCILVPRLRVRACLRSHAAHPEYNLHRVLASSIKLKCANNLEVKIKPWPTQVESNDLMDQTGWLESQSAAHESTAGRGSVWANRERVLLQPLTVGGISGWWVHEWSLAVTAADGWRNPSGQRVFSSSRELNTDRRRHLACTYTHAEHWELLFKQTPI